MQMRLPSWPAVGSPAAARTVWARTAPAYQLDQTTPTSAQLYHTTLFKRVIKQLLLLPNLTKQLLLVRALLAVQTRRLSKFPEAAKQKMEAFQQRPPRHAIAREQTRQKLPDLGLPAEVRCWGGGGGGGGGFQ